MKSQATLKKIAEHLNLSISTVSRALKDHPDVAGETIRRVKDLADLLNYEPNAFAVNLRQKHSNIYAIIVPELAGFFYNSFIDAVEEEAQQRGYNIMVLQTREDPGIEENNLKLCRYNHVAGIFVAITRHTNDFTPFVKTMETEIPIVFFDKVPDEAGFPSVSIADEEMGALAAEKIIHSGKSKILAIMGNQALSITHRRESGFRSVIEKNAQISLSWVYSESETQAYDTIMNLPADDLKDLVVFCMSDELLCGVMQAFYERKVSIPEDVGVLSMSNGFFPKLFNPPVSYVETSGYQLGKLSFTCMLDLIDGVEYLSEVMLRGGYIENASL